MSNAPLETVIHVLLVEDHALLRGILVQTLTAAGHRVTAAESADQAIALIEGGARPDLLLSDIRMPGRLNGLDLARLVRQRYPSVAILLQTGFAEFDTIDFPVLHKPFDSDTIQAAIRDVLAVRAHDLGAGKAQGI
jgi:CheY-like chemotaxis protein